MIQYFPYIIITLNLIFGLLFLSAFIYFKIDSSNRDRFSKFENYTIMLQYYMDKSYEIIYKDRILIYSLEATALNDEQFKTVAKDFCILVLSLMGPTIEKELTKILGNSETLYFNMTEFFNTRFDDDEIRKTTQDNFINDEVDEQGT